MITDSDRKILIPSLKEVIAALEKVHPAHINGPSCLEVKVDDAEDDNRLREIGETFNKILNSPTIELRRFRYIAHGREFSTWKVTKMPEFHL